jgi:hypothetical protein
MQHNGMLINAFVGIAINGHPDHQTDITIEFTSKNWSKTYITLTHLLVLPYMVTSITKQTPHEHFIFCRLIRKDTNLGPPDLDSPQKYTSDDI